jgi:hypothetical protein
MSADTKPHPHLTETRSLLRHLSAAGFQPYKVDDMGDDDMEPVTKSENLEELAQAAYAVDEALLYVRQADGQPLARLFLVYGNSPGELVCDWNTFKKASDTEKQRLDASLTGWAYKQEERHGE